MPEDVEGSQIIPPTHRETIQEQDPGLKAIIFNRFLIDYYVTLGVYGCVYINLSGPLKANWQAVRSEMEKVDR